MDNFPQQESLIIKISKFCRRKPKTQFFAIKKLEVVNEYLKNVIKNMTDRGIRTHYLWAA